MEAITPSKNIQGEPRDSPFNQEVEERVEMSVSRDKNGKDENVLE